MPINVLNFEVSSGAFSVSAIYAPGIEIMGASVDPVEVAVEGAGEYLSRAMDEPEEAESMMTGRKQRECEYMGDEGLVVVDNELLCIKR